MWIKSLVSSIKTILLESFLMLFSEINSGLFNLITVPIFSFLGLISGFNSFKYWRLILYFFAINFKVSPFLILWVLSSKISDILFVAVVLFSLRLFSIKLVWLSNFKNLLSCIPVKSCQLINGWVALELFFFFLKSILTLLADF